MPLNDLPNMCGPAAAVAENNDSKVQQVAHAAGVPHHIAQQALLHCKGSVPEVLPAATVACSVISELGYASGGAALDGRRTCTSSVRGACPPDAFQRGRCRADGYSCLLPQLLLIHSELKSLRTDCPSQRWFPQCFERFDLGSLMSRSALSLECH